MVAFHSANETHNEKINTRRYCKCKI